MKYINHMTRSAEDDKHDALRERHGPAGYGAYWIIAEKIGAQIAPEQITVWMVRSWKKWAQIIGVSSKKSRILIKTMNELNLIRLHSDDTYAAIGMPNILKYADEYIKKVLRESGQTPESLGSLSSPPALPAVRTKKRSKAGPVDNLEICGDLTAANSAGGALLDAAPPPAAADVEVEKLGEAIRQKRMELGLVK